MSRSLVLLVCLLLSLQAPAAVLAQSEPCPMHDMMAAPESAESVPGAEPGDCCNDFATYHATGQTCKAGQDCQAPAAGLLMVDDLRVASVPTHAVRHAALPSQTDGAPARLWRPPTSL